MGVMIMWKGSDGRKDGCMVRMGSEEESQAE